MSWDQLIKHPYITSAKVSENQEDQLHLSYSHHTGHFAREDVHRPIDESNIMMKIDPYNYLDERNAIMLNVKNPA
jgi:hypothetical protein